MIDLKGNALYAYRKVSQSHCPVGFGFLSHLCESDNLVVAADAANWSPCVESHMCTVVVEVKPDFATLLSILAKIEKPI